MATNFNYTPNIPLSTHKPSQDQPDMQTNTNSINSIINVDHLTFNQASGSESDGMHKVIRQPTGPGTQNLTRAGAGATYANNPANITGINQIIAGQYTPDTTAPPTDTQLFNITGLNVISQLTGILDPAANITDGWAWVGGILVQWGIFNAPGGSFSTTSTTGNITYKDRVTGAIPFPNFCFFVGGTPLIGGAFSTSSTASLNIRKASIDESGFQWQIVVGNSQFVGFLWYAIGN